MNKKTGLTLMEILVSTVIMALVMFGLANLFIAGKRHLFHARSRATVGELGRYFLEPLQMQVRADTWSNSCLGTGSGCDTTPQTIDNITYTPSYNITNLSGTTLCKVKLTLTWNEFTP